MFNEWGNDSLLLKTELNFGGIFEYINRKFQCFLTLFIRLYTWTRKRQNILRMLAQAPKTTRKKPNPVSFNLIFWLSTTENHLITSLKCKSVKSKTLAVFLLSANPSHIHLKNAKWLRPKAKISAKKKSSPKTTYPKLQSIAKGEFSTLNAKSKI